MAGVGDTAPEVAESFHLVMHSYIDAGSQKSPQELQYIQTKYPCQILDGCGHIWRAVQTTSSLCKHIELGSTLHFFLYFFTYSCSNIHIDQRKEDLGILGAQYASYSMKTMPDLQNSWSVKRSLKYTPFTILPTPINAGFQREYNGTIFIGNG